ncbi:MAG: hypothetical protein LAP85_04775 [Acidobacteriia bacterium]|nr:hypothetical protein [Terriglobia bacterium]
MKYLAVLLHFYQPPTQLPKVTQHITETCYRPLSRLIERHPRARFTVNFNFSLTEQLVQKGYTDVIHSLSHAARVGHIEFTESSAYHYILPLSPPEVVLDQLRRNRLGNRRNFAQEYKPRGVFPPEMAYSPELPTLVQKAGYEWTITDDVALATSDIPVPYEHVLTVNDLPVFLRSRLWSSRIGSGSAFEKAQHLSGREYLDWLKRDLDGWFGARDGYVIVALDAETFGYHVPGYIERFLTNLLDNLDCHRDIRLCTVSDILYYFPQRAEWNLPCSSWSTSADQLMQGDAFPLWRSPRNPIHQAHWALVEHVLALLDTTSPRASAATLHWIDPKRVQAGYSCQFWWANPGIFFDPEQVIRGANMFLEIVFALMQEHLLTEKEVCQTLSLYLALTSQLQLSSTGEECLRLLEAAA